MYIYTGIYMHVYILYTCTYCIYTCTWMLYNIYGPCRENNPECVSIQLSSKSHKAALQGKMLSTFTCSYSVKCIPLLEKKCYCS